MPFLSLIFGGVLKAAGGIFGQLFAWLRTLNVWQIGCLVLGIFAGIQHIAIVGERHHSAKITTQLTAMTKLYHDEQASFARFAADVKAKTELAQEQDAAHKAQVEHDQNRISQESDNDIRQKIAAAVAAVRSRMQPAAPTAHPGSGGSPAVSGAADPAGRPHDAGQEAVVPAADLTTCAANTIMVEGWQSWWKNVSAVPR